jgi:hypothetical protein
MPRPPISRPAAIRFFATSLLFCVVCPSTCLVQRKRRISKNKGSGSGFIQCFKTNTLSRLAYSPKKHNSLNTPNTAESAQLYYAFLPLTISLTRHCHRKRKVPLCFSLKMLTTIQKCAVTKTRLIFAASFWR